MSQERPLAVFSSLFVSVFPVALILLSLHPFLASQRLGASLSSLPSLGWTFLYFTQTALMLVNSRMPKTASSRP